MVADGLYYALGLAAGGALISWFTRPAWGIPLFVLALFCLWFFRDPDRAVPAGEVAVSPADGKVVAIKKESPSLTRISIFLNIFDVHVNRTPIAGKITKITYKPGKFLVASKEEASTENEMNTFMVEGDGTKIVFSQIAGLIARRIVCWKKVGDNVQKGDRVGLIKFGSRVDILMGPEWEIAIAEGQRVSAGSSVIAKRRRL
jgi:phosphatidylserine decarboxylase